MPNQEQRKNRFEPIKGGLPQGRTLRVSEACSHCASARKEVIGRIAKGISVFLEKKQQNPSYYHALTKVLDFLQDLENE